MEMDRPDEVQFERLLTDAIDQVKPLGYKPTRFIGMINSQGGFRTVKQIVASGQPSEGFDKLVLLGKTNLTCEAIIVESKWRRFFDEDLLQIAEQRLTRYGYAFKRFEFEHAGTDDFDPGEPDHRERSVREQTIRRGQPKFREALEQRYGCRCCVTGTDVPEALEAAHVAAYRGEGFNHAANGLLLRADLHYLFDRYLLSIEPETLTIRLAARIRESSAYRELEGRALLIRGNQALPSRRALSLHWKTFSDG